MSADYREGGVYFRLTYPDREMRYPQVESFVFVGKNLSDEDSEDTWYFQFSSDYARNGSTRKGAAERQRVTLATIRDLGDMLSLEDLVRELEAASMRRQA
jgi:hypothetical protein